MRSGKLLAEESPHALLSMYGCQSLEEVFLKLSRQQGQIGGVPIQTDANISNNISLASLNWNKKDAISVTEESGVVGLNFHQSKEVLINDRTNGHIDVSKQNHCIVEKLILLMTIRKTLPYSEKFSNN